MNTSCLTWRHHNGNIHNIFFGDPAQSSYAATIYPFDGGFLWEVRFRNTCCSTTLIRKGSARKVENAMRSCVAYLGHLLNLSKLRY